VTFRWRKPTLGQSILPALPTVLAAASACDAFPAGRLPTARQALTRSILPGAAIPGFGDPDELSANDGALTR